MNVSSSTFYPVGGHFKLEDGTAVCIGVPVQELRSHSSNTTGSERLSWSTYDVHDVTCSKCKESWQYIEARIEREKRDV